MSELAATEQRHAVTGRPSVQIEQVYKDYGSTRAVDGISLTVEQGEFLTLLGPSGCGKTTTLRMIGGFEYPTAGRISIDGEVMGNRPPYRRPVNTVFQNYALFPHMTVGQNIGYGLEMSGVPKKERERRVTEALELVRLPQVEGRKPSQLSGGQQQRIALARALVNRPQVLLLDEPLGALDLKLRKAMQFELKSLNRQVGITFIYVTHDQDEALTMSDRIAVMNAGKILQLGNPKEIYEFPRSRFVADFIGETNMLRGTLDAIDGQVGSIGIQGVGQIRAVASRNRTFRKIRNIRRCRGAPRTHVAAPARKPAPDPRDSKPARRHDRRCDLSRYPYPVHSSPCGRPDCRCSPPEHNRERKRIFRR